MLTVCPGTQVVWVTDFKQKLFLEISVQAASCKEMLQKSVRALASFSQFFFISDGWIGGLRDLGSMILHIQGQHSLAEKATTNWPRSFNWFYVVTRHQEPRVYRAFDLPTPNMFLFQECHLALGEHCVGPQPASVVCCYLLLVRDFLNWGFTPLKFEIMGPQLND